MSSSGGSACELLSSRVSTSVASHRLARYRGFLSAPSMPSRVPNKHPLVHARHAVHIECFRHPGPGPGPDPDPDKIALALVLLASPTTDQLIGNPGWTASRVFSNPWSFFPPPKGRGGLMRRLPALAGFARFPRSRQCAARLVLAITIYVYPKAAQGLESPGL